MSIINKSFLYARKLSVFFLFLIVFAIFFVIYFYKFIPNNREEFTERAFRILNQLSANIIQKNSEVKATFSTFDELKDSSTRNYFLKKTEVFQSLNENLAYEPDTITKKGDFIVKDKQDNWNFSYRTSISLEHDKTRKFHADIKTENFLNPILQSRSDLFGNYLLLGSFADSTQKDSTGINTEEKSPVVILYQQHPITSATRLNIDTLYKLKHNSDCANAVNISIAGTSYKTFLLPFSFNGRNLLLAGILPAAEYEKQIKLTPTGFIPVVIIIILLILVSLPFIKIFLLSPKEQIGRKDVLFTTLSIFVGSSLFVLVSFYLLFEYTNGRTFNTRLADMRNKIKADIENEISQAGLQLNRYDTVYQALDTPQKKVLLYTEKTDSIKKSVDSRLAPKIYKNVRRLFWIDSAGNTEAKWNPFDFYAPFSKVTNYDFFKILIKQKLPSDTTVGSDHIVVYPGQSNITGEFQFYIARPCSYPIYTFADESGKGDQVKYKNKTSYAIVIAASLNTCMHPVLPPGFSFCLVDKAGKVLLHSDEHRNLSENIITETAGDQRLKNCIESRDECLIDKIDLYGQPDVFGVTPITGQDMSLVVFYNKNLLFCNTLRLLHFSVETLIYLYLVLIICIFYSTGVRSKLSLLKFNLKRWEWIRPSFVNIASYKFTNRYFFCLLLFIPLLFISILLFDLDLRLIFYISLLLPLYALWGFIASRKTRMLTGEPDSDSVLGSFFSVIQDSPETFVFVLIINAVIWIFNSYPGFAPGKFNITFILLFQVAVTTAFLFYYKKIPAYKSAYKLTQNGKKPAIEVSTFTTSYYLPSLILAVLLIGILPAIGIVVYGFQAEKIQFKKEKQMTIARAYDARRDYLSNARSSVYKKVVRDSIAGGNYFDSVKLNAGVYLTDKDQVISDWKMTVDSTAVFPLSDQPYASLMDNILLISSLEFKSYSIKNSSADNAWSFSGVKDKGNQSLFLSYSTTLTDSLAKNNVFISSTINNPLKNFWHFNIGLKLFVLVYLILFMLGAKLLLKIIVQRLFLLNYIAAANNIEVDENFLADFFQYVDVNSVFLKGFEPQLPLSKKFFTSHNHATGKTSEQQILAIAAHAHEMFRSLWSALSSAEQYFIFDFAMDGYTNYRDSDTLYMLVHKGIIIPEEDRFMLFSPSFRNFLLAKKGGPEIRKLKEENAIPGMWETLRIPVLVIIAVAAIFLFITQQDFSHQLTAILTTAVAIVPLMIKLFEKAGSGATAAKPS